MASTAAPRGAARPSLTDVGRVAGVSAQTVSRYFTGRGYVGTETRERIDAAIAQLGYRPNNAARSLRAGRSQTLGVLALGPLNYGAAAILSGLTQTATAAGYALMIAQLDLDPELPTSSRQVRRALDAFLSSRVEGIVVTSPYRDTEESLGEVWDSVPILILSGRPQSSHYAATIDSHAAGLLATRHLIELGHRRILHIAGPGKRNESVEREGGYLEALAEAGLDPLPAVRGDWSSTSGHAAGLAVDPSSFSAVFAGNDQMALGFVAAMRERALLAPRDYSIVGVDDMPDARYFSPPLSTMAMDFTRLGETAIQMVLHHIETGERMANQTIAPVLVARESTRRSG